MIFTTPERDSERCGGSWEKKMFESYNRSMQAHDDPLEDALQEIKEQITEELREELLGELKKHLEPEKKRWFS